MSVTALVASQTKTTSNPSSGTQEKCLKQLNTYSLDGFTIFFKLQIYKNFVKLSLVRYFVLKIRRFVVTKLVKLSDELVIELPHGTTAHETWTPLSTPIIN